MLDTDSPNASVDQPSPPDEASPPLSKRLSVDIAHQDCLNHIVKRLMEHKPQLVSQTRDFVQELLRVAMLWDELWLSVLSHWQGHISR